MTYYINQDCIGCAYCQNECPVNAIHYDGDRYHIDSAACIRCGKCASVCLMGAVEDRDASPASQAVHGTIQKSCDFVVVGGGAAGLIAAARYAEVTGGKVIVLEKNRKPGGGGYFAVGLAPCNTQWEKDAGIPDCLEQKVRAAMDMTQGALDEALLQNLFTSLGDVFDWICTWAPAESCFALGTNPFTGEMSVGVKDPAHGAGRFLTGAVLPYLRTLGVEILTETEAIALELDDSGCARGVRARDGGGELEILCNSCLLCTGSLIRSERIRKMVPEFADTQAKRYAHDMPGLTGDGLTLAENAGISLNEESIVLAFVGCMPVAFDETAFRQGLRGDCIRVNLNGQRFCSELLDNKDSAERLMYQPKSAAFTVLDTEVLESAQPKPDSGVINPNDGFPYPGGVADFAATRGDTTPATKEAFRALASRLGQQTVICADSLEDLAAAMGVPVAPFMETVERYNRFCANGQDADFQKPASHLRPIRTAPFFALRDYLYLDGVFGGLDVTADMQVLSRGRIVPGLYAAGDIACGRYVNDRLHKTEVINDYSWAVAGGYMAANHAAQSRTVLSQLRRKGEDNPAVLLCRDKITESCQPPA